MRLGPQGVLKAGSLVATDIIIEGRVEAGEMEAYRWLEIGPGPRFDPSRMKTANLRMAAGAEVKLKGKTDFRDVEFSAGWKARLQAAGLVRIGSGGS